MQVVFHVWTGKQYVKIAHEYTLDSAMVRPDSLQLFLREPEKRAEEKK